MAKSTAIEEYNYVKTAKSKLPIIFFSIAFIALAALSITMFCINSSAQKNMGETQATIMQIKKVEDYDEDTLSISYDVYVSYTIDGVDYENIKLNSYSAGMKVGDIVNINYDLSDPSKIVSKGTFLFIGILAIALLAIVGAVLLLYIRSYRPNLEKTKYYARHNEILKASGTKKVGQIINVFESDAVIINGDRIYSYCWVKYLDDMKYEGILVDGKDISLKSLLYKNLPHDAVGKKVDVYYGEDPYSDYFVDIKSIR